VAPLYERGSGLWISRPRQGDQMNCKRIQEFIITDYIDGQMEDKQKSLLINIWLIVLPVGDI
jgi:hypothetical protein